jgi:hypothetical protein
MSESIETRAGQLHAQIRMLAGQIRADQSRYQRNQDQWNLKTVAVEAPVVETTDERMQRIHNRKPGPARGNDPIIPVTRIQVNGLTAQDYSSVFMKSGGEEFNLKNNHDRSVFLEKFYPDYPLDQWPVVFNRLLTRGTITKAEVPDFVRQLKRAY